jgi:hypothetical protein
MDDEAYVKILAELRGNETLERVMHAGSAIWSPRS